jgi:hypothetical protein
MKKIAERINLGILHLAIYARYFNFHLQSSRFATPSQLFFENYIIYRKTRLCLQPETILKDPTSIQNIKNL